MPLDPTFEHCRRVRQMRGYVPLADLVASLPLSVAGNDGGEALTGFCAAMNHAATARARIAEDAAAGDADARLLAQWMAARGLAAPPCRPLPAGYVHPLHAALEADPGGFLDRADRPYPCSAGRQHWGFDPHWIRNRLALSARRFARFTQARTSDTAVLVGNGPSLRDTDLSLLQGHDVYVTNYALEHPTLRPLARGVAVTNYFVADQAPELFGLFDRWKAYPVWLSHVLPDSPDTLWFPAMGGTLFFAQDPLRAIAWHSTVSFFWMQILFHAGYRKLVLIGFDNSYVQPEGLREGDLIEQRQDDPNHFDPGYFRGKTWQAADPGRMSETYALARRVYEDDGREIVNATVGGKLEVFERQKLAEALRGR